MRFLILVVLSGLLLTACHDTSSDAHGLAELGLIEGTPEAVGLLDLLNDTTTTEQVLVDGVGLSPETASRLTAARPYATLADVDAALLLSEPEVQALARWVAVTGWLPSAPDDRLGTWLGVDFTVASAWATLELANHATERFLVEDTELPPVAVQAVRDARPLGSVAVLASLPEIDPILLAALEQTACAVVD